MTNLTVSADELETIRTVLRTAAKAMRHATWPELNTDDQECVEPNATDNQGARLVELHNRLTNAGELPELSNTDATDLADALDWACGQLAWAPLWEIADEQEQDQANVEAILYDCELSAVLRTFGLE
jgi:hypothetical protein